MTSFDPGGVISGHLAGPPMDTHLVNSDVGKTSPAGVWRVLPGHVRPPDRTTGATSVRLLYWRMIQR